jgi:hypothetical protein
METAQGSLPQAQRNATLYDPWVQAVLLEFPLTPRTREETALVVIWLETNLENSG